MINVIADAVRFATDHRFREFRDQRAIVGYKAREAAAGVEAGDTLLDRDGLEFLPGLVTAGQVAAITAYFRDKPAHDPYRRGRHFTAPDAIPAETHVAHYDIRDILDCPHLVGIANDPQVLDRVSAFIGGPPVLSAMRVWWSAPTPDGRAEHAELFHRDFDDLRFVKLFVYLTDVDEEAGPHLFVRGSHRSDALSHVGRYTDAEVAAAFDAGRFETITGPAGTAFLETTYGIHRGIPPRTKPRLIFQPLYTMRPTIYAPKRPLRSMRASDGAIDPQVSRLLLAHASPARRK